LLNFLKLVWELSLLAPPKPSQLKSRGYLSRFFSQAEGLIAPEAVKSSSREYRSEMDTVAGFLNEDCFKETTNRVGVGTPYE